MVYFSEGITEKCPRIQTCQVFDNLTGFMLINSLFSASITASCCAVSNVTFLIIVNLRDGFTDV